MLSAASNIALVKFTKNITFHNSLHQRVHQYCRIQHQGADSVSSIYSYRNCVGGWEQKGQNDYLEINLGYPRSVTHIGTAGNVNQKYNVVCCACHNFNKYIHILLRCRRIADNDIVSCTEKCGTQTPAAAPRTHGKPRDAFAHERRYVQIGLSIQYHTLNKYAPVHKLESFVEALFSFDLLSFM